MRIAGSNVSGKAHSLIGITEEFGQLVEHRQAIGTLPRAAAIIRQIEPRPRPCSQPGAATHQSKIGMGEVDFAGTVAQATFLIDQLTDL